MDSSDSAQTIEDVEEGSQPGQSVSQTSVRRRFSKQHDALQEKQEFDTDNLNTEIEAFEESPNPPPVVETGVDGLTIIPTPPPAPAPKYHTFSIHILSLLMAFSVLGTLARLGLHALASYPGQSIFPLAWVQAVGCLVMGFTLGIREPLTKLSVCWMQSSYHIFLTSDIIVMAHCLPVSPQVRAGLSSCRELAENS